MINRKKERNGNIYFSLRMVGQTNTVFKCWEGQILETFSLLQLLPQEQLCACAFPESIALYF